ncbi:hypothetical protein NY08_3213 [Rhodococcus sp. B7740]|nr:hypothetical protein NY08_3213 [Rhodococcus sp. B7740]
MQWSIDAVRPGSGRTREWTTALLRRMQWSIHAVWGGQEDTAALSRSANTFA